MTAPLISLEAFDAEWDRCKVWIEPALAYGGDGFNIDDVRERILTNADVWLWPGRNSAVVTEILRLPRLTQLHFWLCGGDLHELIDEIRPVAEAYGVLAGCTRFSTAGRKGWRRVMKANGYEPAIDVCWKDLSA